MSSPCLHTAAVPDVPITVRLPAGSGFMLRDVLSDCDSVDSTVAVVLYC